MGGIVEVTVSGEVIEEEIIQRVNHLLVLGNVCSV